MNAKGEILRSGQCVIHDDRSRIAGDYSLEITLTLALSRSTGRGESDEKLLAAQENGEQAFLKVQAIFRLQENQ